jgi:hypothetical protein
VKISDALLSIRKLDLVLPEFQNTLLSKIGFVDRPSEAQII